MLLTWVNWCRSIVSLIRLLASRWIFLFFRWQTQGVIYLSPLCWECITQSSWFYFCCLLLFVIWQQHIVFSLFFPTKKGCISINCLIENWSMYFKSWACCFIILFFFGYVPFWGSFCYFILKLLKSVSNDKYKC